jgi:putative ABC transport system permease protein
MIKISGLNKYYNKGKSNELHVIDETSLELDDTGLVCILGESGSGKTTLLNTVGGLDTFYSGNLTIGDVTLRKYSSKVMEKLRNTKFGYIFQEQYLLQDQTVAYNIRLALSMFKLKEEEKEARVDYVLQAVEMRKYKKRLVSQLSGGQQQRIAIARALVKTPDIIFADEPTGNLDEANTMRIMSIIKKISQDCLVVLVTHEKRIAEFFADRIIQVKDGKVIKDIVHKSVNTYQFQDDTNLYLKEFEKEGYAGDAVEVNYYHQGSKNKLTLNVVYKNDKFYIQTPEEANVVYLTSGSETQIVDAAKPIVDMEQIEDFDYSLSRLKADRKAKLSFTDIMRMAMDNVRTLGKKQIFMVVSFLITSVLLVLALTDYLTTSSIDKKSIITEDSHYITVNVAMSSASNYDDYLKSFHNIYEKFRSMDMGKDIYPCLNTQLTFAYQGIEQIQSLQYSLENFSYVTMEHFNQKDLTEGRMPEKSDEIIIDKWLIDKFYQSDSILKEMYPDAKNFINLKVMYKEGEQPLTIVGICDLQEPVVYIDKYMGISLYLKNNSIGSLQQLQAAYPGKYDDISLAADEVMVLQSEFDSIGNVSSSVFLSPEDNNYYYIAPNGIWYLVVGTYPTEFGVDSIIGDKYYDNYIDNIVLPDQTFKIYAQESDYQKILDYFNGKLDGPDTTYIKIKARDIYQDELTQYYEAKAYYMNARMIVTITIFAVSMLMLFFTMKSNAFKRMQEVSVYRLMGITRRSILMSFILEIFILTSCTVLPVICILSSIIKFIAGIPSLQLSIAYPWSAAILLIAFLYVVNILVGILPVYGLVNLPPAKMTQQL